MKLLHVLCILFVFLLPAAALDREAFTFTNYRLDVRIEPGQQRLAVRGQITLRNDSTAPQKSVSLQISSTLDWSSIKLAGKAVQVERALHQSRHGSVGTEIRSQHYQREIDQSLRVFRSFRRA